MNACDSQVAHAHPDCSCAGSAGHAHPDANSFILFAKGKYLTGDSGYAGVPTTAQHNTLLVDGVGQGKEGNGHDPWVDFDYDLLNQQRIVAVQATASTLGVIGEAALGYAPKLGLRRFERHLTFDRGIVTIHDTIEAATAHIFTEVLHSDGGIRRGDDGQFDLGPEGRRLRAEIAEPHDVRTGIEDNSVIAPGRPGSVDEGDPQTRGQRLLISTPQPVRSVVFDLRLAIQ